MYPKSSKTETLGVLVLVFLDFGVTIWSFGTFVLDFEFWSKQKPEIV